MRNKALREAEERLAYYRLLRYLLSEEVKEAYKDEQDSKLPPPLDDLMHQLDRRMPKDVHKDIH